MNRGLSKIRSIHKHVTSWTFFIIFVENSHVFENSQSINYPCHHRAVDQILKLRSTISLISLHGDNFLASMECL